MDTLDVLKDCDSIIEKFAQKQIFLSPQNNKFKTDKKNRYVCL